MESRERSVNNGTLQFPRMAKDLENFQKTWIISQFIVLPTLNLHLLLSYCWNKITWQHENLSFTVSLALIRS